jgi:hypothetical protein
MFATFTKRNGVWNLLVTGERAAVAGDVVTAVKANGTSKSLTLSGVVSSRTLPNGSIETVATFNDARAPRRSRAFSGGSYKGRNGICEDAPCCGCCGPVPGYGGAWD